MQAGAAHLHSLGTMNQRPNSATHIPQQVVSLSHYRAIHLKVTKALCSPFPNEILWQHEILANILSGCPLSILLLKQICSAAPLKLNIRVLSAFTPLYEPTVHTLPNTSGRTAFRTNF